MRFSYYIIGRQRSLNDTNQTYFDGGYSWCPCIVHAHKFNNRNEAVIYLKAHESKWATAYQYFVEEKEACDY